ncbi:uncharacterized protein [Nicotiana sylvestris]|uniref:uncharacterized protein n=1 Tax=Nicotiana sylvestris TaxID=4096 RepID=UPI00388C6417
MGKGSSIVAKKPESIKVVVRGVSRTPAVVVKGAHIEPVVINLVNQLPVIDSKVVPWKHEQVVVTYKGKEIKEEVCETQGLTRSGRCFAPEELRKVRDPKENPVSVKKAVTEEEAEEFLKKMKVQDYSIVEHLRKTSTQISLLSLLIHSYEHRRVLMKILNEAHVSDKISVDNDRIHKNNICVRGFDGGGTDTLGDIILELKIGLVEFTMAFQMVKFEWDRQEIVVHGEDNMSTVSEAIVPFIETDDDKGPWVYQVFDIASVQKFPEGKSIPVPRIMAATVILASEMLKNGFVPGKGLGADLQGIVQPVYLPKNLDTFGLGFKPTTAYVRRARKMKKRVWVLPKPISRLSREIEVYVDDVIVKSRQQSNHVKDLRKFFPTLRRYNLKLNPAKLADALATLASMLHHPDKAYVDPLPIRVRDQHAYCNVVEEELDDDPWFHDIKEYIRMGVYLIHDTGDQKRTIRRLASGFFLSGGVLYKRTPDLGLLRCIDARQATSIMTEVHPKVCGPHMSGYVLAKKILRAGYYWFTMERDCISYVRKCHQCQVHGDLIHFPSSELHTMTTPWPFVAWGMDVIGPIEPATSNAHRFILVIITDNGANLNSHLMKKTCEHFKITHHHSTPYRPKANGVVEAANKNIKKIFRKTVEGSRRWDEKLSFALLGYRTTIRTSVGATPYSLVYGTEAVIPAEVEIPSLRIISEADIDDDEWFLFKARGKGFQSSLLASENGSDQRVRGMKQQHGYTTVGLSEVREFESQSESQAVQGQFKEFSQHKARQLKDFSARMPSTNNHFKLTKFALIETGAEKLFVQEEFSIREKQVVIRFDCK